MRPFISELKNGLKHPVYVLCSPDQYLLHEAKRMVKRTVPEEALDFSFESFDADLPNFSAEALINALKSIPFMGGRMTVVLENAEELGAADLKKLASYAERPERETLFLLLFNSKKPPKEFEGKAKVIPLLIREGELPGWIGEKAREEGLTFSGELVRWLMENFNSEPGLIAPEIKKFALVGKSRIGLDDIKGLTGGMAEYSAFDLVNALEAGDFDRIFRISRAFTAQEDLIMFMGALNSAYRKKKLPPGKGEEIFAMLAEADTQMRALGGAYPLEELLLRLRRI